jgi:4a-hydroxytetrahydrobiopterin dehydratase
MAQPLTEQQIAGALTQLAGWRHHEDSLTKQFTFGGFPEALSFMVRVGFRAEAANHHPDWSNVYNRVNVKLSTHDAGGKVTQKDVDLAGEIENLSWL